MRIRGFVLASLLIAGLACHTFVASGTGSQL